MRPFAVVIVAIVFGSHAIYAQQRDRDLQGMVRIPASTFVMGTEPSKVADIAKRFNIESHPDLINTETPAHSVSLSAFYVDIYEVTNEQFARFLKQNPKWRPKKVPKAFDNGNYLKDWNGTHYPETKANFPVVNVTWYAAVAYCRSVEKRLPTEAEWEFAARGGLREKTFPWGDQPPDRSRVNFAGSGLKTATPVGSYPANGYGLFDMAGNVWEFVADEWLPYTVASQTDPVGGGDRFVTNSYKSVTSRRVIRGGSFGGAPLNLRVTYRDSHPPNGAREFVGFRCAK